MKTRTEVPCLPALPAMPPSRSMKAHLTYELDQIRKQQRRYLLFNKFTCINTKIGKQRGNSYRKNEEISRWKAYTNTWKFNWNILTITDVFLNQKRVNVCDHMIKMGKRESFGKVPLEGSAKQEGRGVQGMERKLIRNHLRLMPGLSLEDRTN